MEPIPPSPLLPKLPPPDPPLPRPFVPRPPRPTSASPPTEPERSDGTGAVEFTVLEFVEKLAAIVPPARANQVLYSGVLAGNAGWRKAVIPKVATSESAKAEARLSLRLVKRRGAAGKVVDAPGWADLLKRVFGVDGWQCPCCGLRMTLRTIVIGAPASTTVVSGLLRARAPPERGGEGDDRGA